jgi:hypothetical protein
MQINIRMYSKIFYKNLGFYQFSLVTILFIHSNFIILVSLVGMFVIDSNIAFFEVS